jgi:hypothetical protein
VLTVLPEAKLVPLPRGLKFPPPRGFPSSRDEPVIRQWEAEAPGRNYGLTNVLAVDVDVKDGAPGLKNWNAWRSKLGIRPSSGELLVHTAGDGWHMIGALPAGAWRPKSGVEPLELDVERKPRPDGSPGSSGIDIKGPGNSYVVAVGGRLYDDEGNYRTYRLAGAPRGTDCALPEALVGSLRKLVGGERKERCAPGAVMVGVEADDLDARLEGSRISNLWPLSVEGAGGHDNLLKLAHALGDIGLSSDGALDFLRPWNQQCSPPFEESELEYQVETMFAGRENPIGCNHPSFGFLPVGIPGQDEFAGISLPPLPATGYAQAQPSPGKTPLRWFDSGDPYDLDEMSWLLDGMLPAQGVGFIGGPSQCGKTFLAYALARCCATGEAFFGEEPEEQISTIVLQSESYLSGRKRLHAIDVQRGSAAPLPISILDAGGIGTESERKAIVEAIVAKRDEYKLRGHPRLGLIVLDTLSASRLISEENSNDAIADAILFLHELAREFHCLVLVTHHPPKSSSSGLRGGGAMFANVDVVIEIARDGKAAVREVECVKQRDGEQGTWGHFTLPVIDVGRRRNGKPVTSCYVSMSEGAAPPEAKPLEGAERGALELLEEMFAEDQRHGADTPLDSWSRLCAEDNRVCTSEKPNSRRKAASRAIEGLLKKGRVTKSGTGYNVIVRPAVVGFHSAPIERPL